MIDPRLEGKVALVTGANHGIGAATARSLAEQGAKIAIAYLDGPPNSMLGVSRYQRQFFNPGREAAEDVLRVIESTGGSAIAIDGDLADPETPQRLLDEVERQFGPVDILVNNADHCEKPDNIEETSAGSIDRHFAVNVRAAVLLIAEFVARFRKTGRTDGRIVNVSTDAAQTFPTQISYGASKSAMEAYTRSIAVEVGKYGIAINTVAPGPVHTGEPSSHTPELEEQLTKSIPRGRCGQPEDIANAILFLVSEQASWITGRVIKVDGGHAAGAL